MKAVSLSGRSQPAVELSLVCAFTFFMILAAYLRIPLPFSPVPLTLQTFVLYVSILCLRRKAFLPQAVYLLLGALGFPVFSNGGAGLLYLLGPTGGYIAGFFIVALIFPGFLREKNNFWRLFPLFILANAVIYLLGLAWLVVLHHFSFSAALSAGVLPFIPGDIFKVVLVSFFPYRNVPRA